MSPGDVPELALGCAALARVAAVDEETAAATVHAALGAGLTLFDTAPHYGAGVSERRLGDALRGVARSRFRISTKVGRAIVDGRQSVHDHSYDGAWRSLEGSLARLGVDRVDVLHAHDPLDVPTSVEGEFRALVEMRDQGVVDAIGCGMNWPGPLVTYLTEVELDCVMVANHLNLLDQGASPELLPQARKRGVDVWVAGVFATGVLAAPTDHGSYRYLPAPSDIRERVARIRAICEHHGVDLVTAAIHYPWRYGGVRRLVVGAQHPAEVTQAAEAAGRAVPDGLWQDLDGAGLVPMATKP